MTKPSVVTGVTTSAADAQVTVHWNANDTSESVARYDVFSASVDFTAWSSSLVGATVTSGVACCSFVRGGLTNDKPYWFAVAAINSAGTGAASAAVEGLPPGWEGTQIWGTAMDDRGTAVALDGSGNLYVVGSTRGSIGPEGNAGGQDGVILKYDDRGRLLWAHQWGTTDDDTFAGVTVAPSGAVYVTGVRNILTTSSAVLLRFTSDGSLTWVKSLAAADGFGIASSGDPKLFVALVSYGTYGTFTATSPNPAGDCGDAAVGEYDTAGGFVWGAEIGSDGTCGSSQAIDIPNAVSVDSNGVTIAGQTSGTFNGETAAGGYDLFVARFRKSDGAFQWVHQIGSSANDIAYGVASDAAGNVYVAGYTSGTMPSKTSSGSSDVVVASWSAAGSLRWTTQFGTSGADAAYALTVTQNGVFVAGSSVSGPIGAVSPDVFLARLDPGDGQVLEIHPVTNPSGNETAGGLTLGPTGSAYVTGFRQTATETAPDGFLMKFGPAGDPL